MPEATLAQHYRALVCDLDGVVYRGPMAVPHAVESLTAVGMPVIYATNNASRSPATVAKHLVELGLQTDPEAVATSSQAAASELRRRVPAGATVLAVGGAGVAEALEEQGFAVLTPDQVRGSGRRAVAAVVQGYGPDVRASDLAEAAYAVQRGAVWMATNEDLTLPTERGLAPGNGAMVAAVRLAVGSDPIVVGKPAAPLYLLCAERLGLESDQLLAVGDRLDTDIAGAIAAGLDSVLVLTGVCGPGDLAVAGTDQRPTYVVEDLRALGLPYEPVREVEGWWLCGAAGTRVTGGHWEVKGQGSRIERLRAGLGAVHRELDDGRLGQDRAADLLSGLWPAQ